MRLSAPSPTRLAVAGKPLAVFLDLPMMPDAVAPEDQLRVAVWAKPWRAQALYVSPEATGFTHRATIVQPATVGELAALAGPGVEGRVQKGAEVMVRLYGGELSSTSRLQMLNGANAAAIRSASGAWEIIQFETAEEIAPDLWRLSNLLRGQLGTGDAMAAGTGEGATFVLLDRAVKPAGLARSEAGVVLNWRVGPTGHDFTGEYFDLQSVTGGLRALTPLAPAHLRTKRTGAGDLAVGWIRRGRIDADGWLGTDIPLGEEAELYQVDVKSTSGSVIRTVTVSESAWVYPVAAIAADFPAPGGEADIVVRQLSAAAGPGLPATRRISLG